MNVVELKSVTKRFDQFIAVKDLSFEVRQGTIFGLLGPNGAGKTTSIRMIVNIFAPDDGDVLVMSKQVSPELQPFIGYLPEERGLYKKMKIGDQLVFFANLKGVSSSEASRRVDDWLKRLELSDWKNKKPTDLSKGMQQKVQFIGSIIHNPEVMILDEPFSGLDVGTSLVLRSLIQELAARGKVILFSSHELETVERVCERVVILHRGKVVADDSIDRLRTLMESPTLEEIFRQLAVEQDTAAISREIADLIEA